MERALELTTDYTKERKAFGKPIIDFQNTALQAGRAQDRGQVGARLRRLLPRAHARRRARHRHGVDGEVLVYARSRARSSTSACSCTAATATCRNTRSRALYADARVQRIYGGTNEIMKELIGRTLERLHGRQQRPVRMSRARYGHAA